MGLMRLTAPLAVAMAILLAGCGVQTGGGPWGGSAETLPRNVPDVPAERALETAKFEFSQGNFGYAARYYQQAAQVAPDSLEACLGLAASYDWLGQFTLADKSYPRCLKIGGRSFFYLNNLGFSYLLRGDLGRASAYLYEARALQPGHPVVETNLEILRDAASS